ncbi:MAG: MFS transporter [OCS116 cluster bacterium]|nr:MFS transporter [OCS116 cluster bacterium]
MSHQIKVYTVFFLYSLTLGGIFPRLGEMQLAMGAGEAALGLGLLGFALGTQISLMFSNPLIEKIGYKWIILLAVPLLGVAEIAASLASSIPLFFTSLLAAGVAIGALEIVINLEADRTEHMLGRRVMNRAHAFWSLGFFAAGMLGAAAAQMAISPTLWLVMLNAVATLILWVVLWGFTPAPERTTSDEPAPKFVRPSLGILTLVALTLSAMMLEGAGADWSIIFMRDNFEMSAFVNGMAFAVGAGTQAITRYFADGFIDKFGPVRIARILISILGLGTLMVTFSPNAYVALLGFAFIGIGSSSLFPLAMSAAAQRTDRPAATNVASLAQLSFIIFLLAPPLLGFVAEHFGIRYSFGIGLPLVLLSWFTVHSLKVKT